MLWFDAPGNAWGQVLKKGGGSHVPPKSAGRASMLEFDVKEQTSMSSSISKETTLRTGDGGADTSTLDLCSAEADDANTCAAVTVDSSGQPFLAWFSS